MMQVGKAVGMVSLNDALMELVSKRVVAPEEAYSKSVDKPNFEALLKRNNVTMKLPQALGAQGPGAPGPSWPVVDPVVARPSGAVLYSLGSNGARTPYLASNARIVSGTSVARLINEFVG